MRFLKNLFKAKPSAEEIAINEHLAKDANAYTCSKMFNDYDNGIDINTIIDKAMFAQAMSIMRYMKILEQIVNQPPVQAITITDNDSPEKAKAIQKLNDAMMKAEMGVAAYSIQALKSNAIIVSIYSICLDAFLSSEKINYYEYNDHNPLEFVFQEYAKKLTYKDLINRYKRDCPVESNQTDRNGKMRIVCSEEFFEQYFLQEVQRFVDHKMVSNSENKNIIDEFWQSIVEDYDLKK